MGDQHLYIIWIISFQFNPRDTSIGQYDLDILLFPKKMIEKKSVNCFLQKNYIFKKSHLFTVSHSD